MTAMPRAASVPARTAKTARLSLRVSVEQKRLFEGASAASNQTMTEFVVRSAELAARDVLADRTRFVLPQEEWEAFSTALDVEPRDPAATGRVPDHRRPAVILEVIAGTSGRPNQSRRTRFFAGSQTAVAAAVGWRPSAASIRPAAALARLGSGGRRP
jgi:uncharacterized protein (DUF1778 family)